MDSPLVRGNAKCTMDSSPMNSATARISTVICMLLFNDLEFDPRVMREARALGALGYTVHILAIRRRQSPREANLTDRVLIRRIFPFPFVISAPHKYLANMILFGRYLIRHFGIYRAIHCHDAETLPFGFIMKIANPSAAVIYDAHEFIRSYLPLPRGIWRRIGYGMTYKLYGFFERCFIGHVNGVISVSDTLVNMLRQTYDLSCPGVSVRNLVEPCNTTDNSIRERFNLGDGKVLIFTGSLDRSRELERLVEVLSKLSDDYYLMLLGRWTDITYQQEIISLAEQRGVRQRLIEYYVPYDRVVSVLSGATCSIFLAAPTTTTLQYCMPNKLWESIAAGVPFVVNSELHEMAEFIRRHKIGLVLESLEPHDIAATLSAALTTKLDYWRNNVKELQGHLTWEIERQKMSEFYECIGICAE